MGRREDQIDVACKAWAVHRRQLLGLSMPSTSRGYVGALRCTLAARRDLHAGAKSNFANQQHWPEFPYPPGDPSLVNTVFKRMPEALQEIMDVHFTVLEPRDKRIRADLLGLSLNVYWDRVARAKERVAGAFDLRAEVSRESVSTLSDDFRGISAMRATVP